MVEIKIQSYESIYKPQMLEIFKKNMPKFFANHELPLFEKYLDAEGHSFHLVLTNKRLVGGGGFMYHPVKHNGYITWLLIDPEFHGKGFGKALTTHALNGLRSDERVKKMVVRTSQFAKEFFEKQGFKLRYTKEDYWAKGIHLYYMEQAV